MTMFYSCLIFAILLPFSSAYAPNYGDLTIGYYNNKCPGAEDAIANAVAEEVAYYPGLCAGIIRLHFHDCFVRGCDGSVLLENDAYNNPPEKSARNNLSLRGFEVINAAKEAVEAKCNKTSPVVSCADVLAFAARECVKILGGFSYDVYAGRLDGKVSIADEAKENLPGANFNFAQLKDNFEKNGLSAKDLVVLSGAHSIGVSHCRSFKGRVTNITDTEIDRAYAEDLKMKCFNDSVTVPQDHVTPDKLDNYYYKNMNENKVLFFSDWVLRTDSVSQILMTNFAAIDAVWQAQFKSSMQKMGNIIKLAAGEGEIRKVCSAVNTNY